MALNDLSGREWLPMTRSAFVDGVEDPFRTLTWDDALSPRSDPRSTRPDPRPWDSDPWDGVFSSRSVLSRATARPDVKKQHPATFPESDAQRLVKFFTREGETVLDPFMGSGSTAVACALEHRQCIGFELYDLWASMARDRAATAAAESGSYQPWILTDDALSGMTELEDDSIDFVLTSPPYWGILEKTDHKAKTERQNAGLPTNYGDDSRDLSNTDSYDDFLDEIECHFSQWRRVLRDRSYAAVIVSDFRHGRRYYPLHADIGHRLECAGLTLQGLVVIVQDSKRLYPYGFPTTYVPNICNQFVVIARLI